MSRKPAGKLLHVERLEDRRLLSSNHDLVIDRQNLGGTGDGLPVMASVVYNALTINLAAAALRPRPSDIRRSEETEEARLADLRAIDHLWANIGQATADSAFDL